MYANVSGNGITFGTGTAEVSNAVLNYNLIVNNGIRGVQSRFAYSGQYNMLFGNIAGSYGGSAAGVTGDRVQIDPHFVNPAGPDGRVGGNFFLDDAFTLSQRSAGQDVQSAAVDGGPVTAEKAGVADGSTSSTGSPDEGAVDLGFHYVGTPPDVLYVDMTGDDANDGRLQRLPLRTVGAAVERAAVGTRIEVGTGTFTASDLRPPERTTIVGVDAQSTILSAAGGGTVFDMEASDITLTRLGITGAADTGVRNRGDRLQLLNTRVYGNAGRGVIVPTGTGTMLFNNLIYANISTGIVIGSASTGASLVTIAHNTVSGNGGLGISVGLDASEPSPQAAVVNNVIADNSRAGLGASSATVATMQAGYNCNDDGYREMEKPTTDLEGAVRFVDGASGDYHLQQQAAGDPATSRCVDAGYRTAAQMQLGTASTRSDGAADVGTVDMGYHYNGPLLAGGIAALVRFKGPSGDCDGDGVTRINELIIAVNIALGNETLSNCAVLDVNDDGRVTIDELVAAVTDSLGG